jgi:hypothetical protein
LNPWGTFAGRDWGGVGALLLRRIAWKVPQGFNWEGQNSRGLVCLLAEHLSERRGRGHLIKPDATRHKISNHPIYSAEFAISIARRSNCSANRTSD